MQDISHYFCDFFFDLGLSDKATSFFNMLVLLAILCIIILVSDFIARKVLVQTFNAYAKKSKTNFDDLLVSHKAPRNIAHLVPLFLTIKLFPIVFYDFPQSEIFIITILKVYGILLSIWILRSVLRTLEAYFKTVPNLKDKPIDSYIQVVMLFVWITGIGLCFVVITGIPLWTFFTTIGAASAILLLIFKGVLIIG